VFPEPWEGVVAAIGVVLLAALLGQLWQRRHSTAATR